MSQATVVSIAPFPIRAKKPGLHPGEFVVPAAAAGDFELLLVGDSTHYVYLDESRGSFPVVTEARKVAESIVEDHIRATLAATPDARPGLFWVDGALTKAQIAKEFADKLKTAVEKQRKWFEGLVRIADDEWSRTHQHRSITDTQRFAAKSLGLTREWVIDTDKSVGFRPCPMCRSKIDPQAKICPVCRTNIETK